MYTVLVLFFLAILYILMGTLLLFIRLESEEEIKFGILEAAAFVALWPLMVFFIVKT